MALASSLQSVASKLVNKFGGAITYRRIVTGSYNASTGTVVENSTDTAIKGVLDQVSKREVSDLVQAGDKKLIVAAADLSNAPTIADKVIISSRVLQIIRVDTIEQDNQPITYELILRD